eukprot:TRINITY_DN34779_c0_g1_i1.p3 TRINITY_DN34779_c0_g1~~TRINITY_DN34779_c0_g1_i1.p3  ORF type:complete len:111 (+),score=46.98 TRINITY_DN34779_c0_g1_i1:94-426(+)
MEQPPKPPVDLAQEFRLQVADVGRRVLSTEVLSESAEEVRASVTCCDGAVLGVVLTEAGFRTTWREADGAERTACFDSLNTAVMAASGGAAADFAADLSSRLQQLAEAGS